jgi:hypothetical protein
MNDSDNLIGFSQNRQELPRKLARIAAACISTLNGSVLDQATKPDNTLERGPVSNESGVPGGRLRRPCRAVSNAHSIAIIGKNYRSPLVYRFAFRLRMRRCLLQQNHSVAAYPCLGKWRFRLSAPTL